MNIIDKRATNPAAALDGTELVYVAQLGDDAVTTVQDIKDFATNGFVAKNAPITGATKTKITYNTDGLITSGADATTADIADSSNRRYITDAQQTVLNNTSNTNSGDETTATIKTKLGAASSGVDGYLAGSDWTTFNSKQAALADVITAGTYGSSTQVPVITFNAKGIATTVNLATIAAPVLTEANFSVAKTGEPTYTVSWVLTALTDARAWTVPDTNLDFGNIDKIPAVATPYTTAPMAGTRPQCLGGSGNTFSSGTDVVAVECTNCTLNGTRIYLNAAKSVTVPSAFLDCSFNGTKNDYQSPLAPLTFDGGYAVADVKYEGWLSPLFTGAFIPKGYKVSGHKDRKSGANLYIYGMVAEVGLIGTSTGTAGVMKCESDEAKLPLSFTQTIQTFAAIHELDLFGISEGSGIFIGKRRIRMYWQGGAPTIAVETVGTDQVTGGFTISLTVTEGGYTGGSNTLSLSVKNTANSTQVHWQAHLRTTVQGFYVI